MHGEIQWEEDAPVFTGPGAEGLVLVSLSKDFKRQKLNSTSNRQDMGHRWVWGHGHFQKDLAQAVLSRLKV